MTALRSRLDRLDGGARRGDVRDMSDAQLHRVIARNQPAPAAWLAWWKQASPTEQDAALQRIVDGRTIQ
jgi:hypothetical protein